MAAALSAVFYGGLTTPVAAANPAYAPGEQQYLSQAATLFSLRQPDKPMLDVGHQACAIRRDGMSSDQAKVAVSNRLADSYGINAPGAVTGSLVHMAVDNLCPEVGYP